MRLEGATVWITGLPRAGKSTLAHVIESAAGQRGWTTRVLDGDELRRTTSRDLGFSPKDRSEQARRASNMARDFAASGGLALVALVSPYADDRRAAREAHERQGLRFLEVFVATPLSECERRDSGRLYTAARMGRVANVTGVDAPYEAPKHAEITVRPEESSVKAADRILTALDHSSRHARTAPPLP